MEQWGITYYTKTTVCLTTNEGDGLTNDEWTKRRIYAFFLVPGFIETTTGIFLARQFLLVVLRSNV